MLIKFPSIRSSKKQTIFVIVIEHYGVLRNSNICQKPSRHYAYTDFQLTDSAGICDIGSAAFNYDMRRLNEILDFPKAWYKRGLVSRLFLGKEGTYATKTDAMATDFTDAPPPSRPGDENVNRR